MRYDKPKFIRLWRSSPSVDAVARRMRCTNQVARLRASYLRKTGTRLKHMPKHPKGGR